MQFQPDARARTSITSYGPDWVAVNGEKYTHSIIVSSDGVRAWEVGNYDQLDDEKFSVLAQNDTELVLFGSGDQLRFPRPQWLKALYARRIGVEAMNTQAACRTYNFLSGEGRRVIAALLL